MTVNRRLRATAVALAGLIALAACGGSPEAQNTGPVSLRMTIWSANEAHLKLFNEIAAEYKQTHPNVTEIKFDAIPFENYTTTLTTQIAGGNGPDLAWMLESSAPDFVSSGALVPLDDTLDEDRRLRLRRPGAGRDEAVERRRQALRLPVLHLAVRRVRQQRPAQAGRAATPAELIAAGKWDWTTVIAAASAVNAKTGKAGLVVRDFDYKTWDNLASVWTGWGAAGVERRRQDVRLQQAGDGRRDDRSCTRRSSPTRRCPDRARPPTSSPATRA